MQIDKAGYLEPAAGWQMLSTLLSPWKLAATSIELRFTMRQLGEALRRDVTKERASMYLDKLTATVFGQGMNSEEGDFMAEMPAATADLKSGFARFVQWHPEYECRTRDAGPG